MYTIEVTDTCIVIRGGSAPNEGSIMLYIEPPLYTPNGPNITNIIPKTPNILK